MKLGFFILLLFFVGCNSSGSGGSALVAEEEPSDDLDDESEDEDEEELPPPTVYRCTSSSSDLRYTMGADLFSSPTTSYLMGTVNKPIETYSPYVNIGTALSFSISPVLPTGLDFNTTTGVISGTPTSNNLSGTTFTVTVLMEIFDEISNNACDFIYEITDDNSSENFTPTNSMITNRQSPEAVLLANGKVLVVGGSLSENYLQSAEIYNAGSFTVSTSTMTRFGADTATLLPTGNVILAGGFTNAGGATENLTIEIYDPIADSFSLSGASLAHPPKSATLLNNGKILFLEGNSDCSLSGGMDHYNAEIFDPSNNSLTNAPFGGGKVANLLNDGTVLIRGFNGCMNDGIFGAFVKVYSAAAAIYDPVGATFNSFIGNSFKFGNNTSPYQREGLKLSNGKIFFNDYYYDMNFMQVYDPVAQTFSYGIIAAGADTGIPVKELVSGEIILSSTSKKQLSTYNITSNILTSDYGRMIYFHGQDGKNVILSDGKILILGHDNSNPTNAEYFVP